MTRPAGCVGWQRQAESAELGDGGFLVRRTIAKACGLAAATHSFGIAGVLQVPAAEDGNNQPDPEHSGDTVADETDGLEPTAQGDEQTGGDDQTRDDQGKADAIGAAIPRLDQAIQVLMFDVHLDIALAESWPSRRLTSSGRRAATSPGVLRDPSQRPEEVAWAPGRAGSIDERNAAGRR